MDENDTIQLPAIKRIWRVTIADSIDTPKTSTAFLIRGGQSVADAVTQAKRTQIFKQIQEPYPAAEVVAVEFVGVIAN